MSSIELTLAQATEVIEEARKPRASMDNEALYPGVLPDSDDQRIQIATELVGFAVDAFVNDNNDAEEVVDILTAGGLTITDEGELLLGGEAQSTPNGSNGNGSADEAAVEALTEGAEMVTLVGPSGDELTVPAAAVGALETAGYVRPTAVAVDIEPDPAEEELKDREREPADDETVVVDISGTKAEMPYGTAKGLIASGAATLVEYDLGPEVPAEEPVAEEPTGDDPYAGEELQEPWEGYNKTSDVDIRKQMEGFTDEEIEYVKAYEARHKKRQRIGNFQRKGPAPEKGAEPEAGPADDAHADLDAQADDAVARDEGYEQAVHEDLQPQPEEEHGHMPILTAHDERRLAIAEVEKSRLPIPAETLEHPPEFPEDIAAVDDKTLHSLHSKFNACLALAIWKHGLVQVDERAFKHIADYHAREVRHNLDPTNPATGKAKGREFLEREAEDDETVLAWRDKQFNAEIRAIPLRRLIDIYSSYVEVLSRQWTFRERERESSGGLPPRS